MTPWSAGLLSRNIMEEVALGRLTTMRIGGSAALLTVNSREDLAEIRQCDGRYLGRGANLLIGDEGVQEPVIRLGEAFAQRTVTATADGAVLQVGAAYDLGKLIGFCIDAGLAGPEGLAGVPASIGGALAMNAGTATVWLFDLVQRVEVVLPGEQQPRWLERSECPAHYRRSGLPPGTWFLACELALKSGDPATLKQTATRLKQAKAASQPLAQRSAGCIFTNPKPEIPAGRLIDELGLKGLRVGGAMVSPIHGNFIVNDHGASAADVAALIRRIRARVKAERGIELTMEVQTWGLDPEQFIPGPGDLG